MKWNKQIDKSQTSRNATYSSQVHTDLLLRFLLILCMCICYATRSSYARADRLAAMLLAQNLHVRADLPLGRQVFRYIVKKKRIEGRGLLDSRWIARQMDGWMYRQIDGWMDKQIDRQIDRSQASCYPTCSSQLRTDLLLRLRFLLFLSMCICYTTRSSYARADRLAAMLLAHLLHGGSGLLLRHLLFLCLCMFTLICCYATCSSYAWQADVPSTLLALLMHEHTDLLLRHLSF